MHPSTRPPATNLCLFSVPWCSLANPTFSKKCKTKKRTQCEFDSMPPIPFQCPARGCVTDQPQQRLPDQNASIYPRPSAANSCLFSVPVANPVCLRNSHPKNEPNFMPSNARRAAMPPTSRSNVCQTKMHPSTQDLPLNLQPATCTLQLPPAFFTKLFLPSGRFRGQAGFNGFCGLLWR